MIESRRGCRKPCRFDRGFISRTLNKRHSNRGKLIYGSAFFCVFCFGFTACRYFDVDWSDSQKIRRDSLPTEIHLAQNALQDPSLLFDVSFSRPLLNKNAISQINSRIKALPLDEQPLETLKWAAQNLPGKWAQVTSFGTSGIAIMHMISTIHGAERAPVITIDTLHLFPETYSLIDEARRRFRLEGRLHTYRTRDASTRAQFEAAYGPYLWRADPPLYDYITKVEPMQRALDELGVAAWVTGRRRSQGGERGAVEPVEVDPADGRMKLNPLAYWDLGRVAAYVSGRALPRNALAARGLPSVGDSDTTAPAPPGQGERAGRWLGQNRSECGIHLPSRLRDSAELSRRARQMRDAYAWQAGSLRRAAGLGIVEVTEETFESIVIAGFPGRTVLLEVYLPFCSHCQEFEPTFNALAARLAAEAALRVGDSAAAPAAAPAEWVVVARMDGWQNRVPARYAAAFAFDSTPALFLAPAAARTRPAAHPPGTGRATVDALLAWVRSGGDSAAAAAATAANGSAALAAAPAEM